MLSLKLNLRRHRHCSHSSQCSFPHADADKATRFKLFSTTSFMLTQGHAMKRILSGATRTLLRSGIGPCLTKRKAPSGINRASESPIKSMIDGGHEKESMKMFRLSPSLFESLVQHLSPHGRMSLDPFGSPCLKHRKAANSSKRTASS